METRILLLPANILNIKLCLLICPFYNMKFMVGEILILKFLKKQNSPYKEIDTFKFEI